ncbi:MAG: hypothetical protein MjAS7_1974 [Metallosphaera javensis (ex Sakai et al. 2022)]|nr:MAG: hypothetical protein MjAS7_1974 [Metallosphaera javensis (ex Sakai et al. 2022)]
MFQTLKGSLQTICIDVITVNIVVVSNPQRISTNFSSLSSLILSLFVSNPQRISTNFCSRSKSFFAMAFQTLKGSLQTEWNVVGVTI